MDKEKMELKKQLLITEIELLKARSQVLQLLHDNKLNELAMVESQIAKLSKEEEKDKPGLECVE